MRKIFSLILAAAALFPVGAFAQVAGANPTMSDCSIASLSGSSQTFGTSYTLGSHSYTRKYLFICNTGATGDNIGVNLTGGTAAIGGTGTETLVPGSCLEFSSAPGSGLPLPPTNAITVIGTSGQPALCIEGR